ncbi:hypothetical protein PVV74_17435 [Roseovarius sp. SK2]|uniref:hypothetical protein n=1 Tax=Roseovarius TaxID=74030 RepID=UPI00237A1E4E|nr:hypothetical protein [Roseovarius sp. SK2]MDD9727246.1 hypothetical protein [Roseovarius sp. SK2]
MKRIPLKGGDEQDFLTGWRKVLCAADRPGVCKAIKRKYNRRFRQKVKAEVQRELEG